MYEIIAHALIITSSVNHTSVASSLPVVPYPATMLVIFGDSGTVGIESF